MAVEVQACTSAEEEEWCVARYIVYKLRVLMLDLDAMKDRTLAIRIAGADAPEVRTCRARVSLSWSHFVSV